MGFVCLHVISFVLRLKVEPFKDAFPYGLLTVIVSPKSRRPEHVHDDQPEPCRREPQVPADPHWYMIQPGERQHEQPLGPLDAFHDTDDPNPRPHAAVRQLVKQPTP